LTRQQENAARLLFASSKKLLALLFQSHSFYTPAAAG